MLRRFAIVAAAFATAMFFVIPAASAGGERTYEVTITNLTPGQPLTPPIVATHKKKVGIFEVGAPASYDLKEVAENGNGGPLLATLGANKKVYDIYAAAAPLVPAADPGGSGLSDTVTFTITAAQGAKYLSYVSMLICTNDGFTGLDALKLPKKVGQSVTVWAGAYDAGTEINTEAFANMVPPCQGLIGVMGDPGTGMSEAGLAEGGVVTHHGGIVGGADLLPGVHGWMDPVVMISVERVG